MGHSPANGDLIERARRFARPYRVEKGKHFRMKDVDPDDRGELTREDKPRAQEALARGIEAMVALQDRLYAQDRWAVLLVFPAIDAAGKDSAIKHVMSGINPQGCQVYSFKSPSSEDLDHDFLWRTLKALPERGRIGVFNRSYYEVEGYLSRNGTLVLKFFLHVSKTEQEKRFRERLDRPEKNWKFSAADLKEREHWREYHEAYEDMIRWTATSEAPWYVVPADHTWFTPYRRGGGHRRWPGESGSSIPGGFQVTVARHRACESASRRKAPRARVIADGQVRHADHHVFSLAFRIRRRHPTAGTARREPVVTVRAAPCRGDRAVDCGRSRPGGERARRRRLRARRVRGRRRD
jgi:polyphosphate kinase 2 (PPK2 family)